MMLDRRKLLAVLRDWQSWLAVAIFVAIYWLGGHIEWAFGGAAFAYAMLFRDWNLFRKDNGGPPRGRYADDEEVATDEDRPKGALSQLFADPIEDFEWGRRDYAHDSDEEPDGPVRPVPAPVDHGVTVPPKKPVQLPRRR